ncbi:hypothetical protein AMS68_002195 [Peltaster fructicola]|uniref:Zn(2)-C6 fungal-type domain-containing protein n=1 Tax=Peltaster fructicola TaxID=286661 RepID=A0A6H0XPW7_9PEZI|nr:hypothetical protein AMS68_002195 [Peltaster fructicola]
MSFPIGPSAPPRPPPQSAASSSNDSDTRPKYSSACDSCKRRKLKCSSTQPCQRCVATGVSCTYGSVASRQTTISYTRHLEAKIAELQSLLLQQPVVETDEQGAVQAVQSDVRDRMVESLIGPEDDHLYLSPDDQFNTFHGRFAGLSVMRTVRDLCDAVAGSPGQQYGRALALSFDSSYPDIPTSNQMAALALLPSREVLEATISIALDDAMSCQECVDRAELQVQIERLYTRDPEDYTHDDRRALALIYALMALGRQCDFNVPPMPSEPGTLILRGVSYYKASRAILDGSNISHLDSIRAIIILANYLLSASMASKAHTIICMGIAAALRMGLHVSSATLREQYSAHELTQRRTVFAVLNFTQVYLSSVLGMPLLLKEPDPMQRISVPEEEMHDQGDSLVTKQPLSPVVATILMCRLLQVLADVTKTYESVSGAEDLSGSYTVGYKNITRWEEELRKWYDNLPPISPGSVTKTVLRAQLLLRVVDASIRLSIYRPFVQHILRSAQDPDFDEKGFECGSSCLQASMQLIWLSNTMEINGLLENLPWYVVYNLTLATSSLMLFELGAKHNTTIGDTSAAAQKARELLSKLGQKCLSARRCSESLDALQNEISQSRTSTVSPRTQFMRAIGAIGEEESTTASTQ